MRTTHPEVFWSSPSIRTPQLGSPGPSTRRLTAFEHRVALLRDAGTAHVHRLEPTDEFLGLSPEGLVEWVCGRFNPCAWVEGPDFHFGRGRAGNMATLRSNLGEDRGFEVDQVSAVAVALTDNTVVTAFPSTIARWLIDGVVPAMSGASLGDRTGSSGP